MNRTIKKYLWGMIAVIIGFMGVGLAMASVAGATTPGPTLDTGNYVSYADNCVPGVTTHTDYKWVSNVINAGPTMWTTDNAPAGTLASFTWKNAQVAYHRDGTKTTQAIDTQCGVHITSQAQLDALVGNGTINNYVNIDVPASVTEADNIWLSWTHITGTVTVEGSLKMSAATIDGNVTVSGPGSFLGLSNYASHFVHDLIVHDSSGIYTGGPGTTSFGNWTQYNGASQVDGNFTFINNSGGLYSGYPMHVNGNFTYTGNTGPVLDRGGLTVDGATIL